MTGIDRRELRAALLEAEPWLGDTELGPQAVAAGSCDRCDRAPRLLPLCGPGAYEAVCRDCAEVIGDDGWCEGHQEDGRRARSWAQRLPDRWAEAAVLWWAATGEVGLDRPADRPR